MQRIKVHKFKSWEEEMKSLILLMMGILLVNVSYGSSLETSSPIGMSEEKPEDCSKLVESRLVLDDQQENTREKEEGTSQQL